MKTNSPKAWNPRRLDVRAFAEAGGRLASDLSLTSLERLASERFQGIDTQEQVSWAVLGEIRSGTDGKPSVWMHLSASVTLPMGCQRCLGPVDTPLSVDRWFRFVSDEATAEAQDDDSEEDVLALEPRPDLLDLLEDELLMALPLVPMHDTCPQPLPHGQAMEEAEEPVTDEKPHPFAALARLKK